MSFMNRLNTALNHYQGKYLRVLCCCSAGCLRSPTAAVVLAGEPYNFNTRACGVDRDFAIVPIDDVLVSWADLIVCMDERQKSAIEQMFPHCDKQILVLDIPDRFSYRDPELMGLIRQRFDALWEKEN